jgi:MSHA biogenesis protein MshJ
MSLSVYVDKLEALSFREQMLIAATLVALLVSMLQFFVVDPLLSQQKALNGQMKTIASNIERQQRLLDGESLTPMIKREALLNAEISDVERQLALHEAEIGAYTSALVPAKKMPSLLQALLEREAVHLVSLINHPPVPLLTESVSELETVTTTPEVQLYAHGIQLELRGDFHTLRRYLLAIEQQPWKLLWQDVSLETRASGESVMQLQLQTLSTDSAWMGV